MNDYSGLMLKTRTNRSQKKSRCQWKFRVIYYIHDIFATSFSVIQQRQKDHECSAKINYMHTTLKYGSQQINDGHFRIETVCTRKQ